MPEEVYPTVKDCPGCTTPPCTSMHISAPLSLSENVYDDCCSPMITEGYNVIINNNNILLNIRV